MSPVPRAEVSEVLPALQQEIARLAGLPEIRHAFAWLRLQEAQFAAWQLEMARIAAPPFAQRAFAMHSHFCSSGTWGKKVRATCGVCATFFLSRAGRKLSATISCSTAPARTLLSRKRWAAVASKLSCEGLADTPGATSARRIRL